MLPRLVPAKTAALAACTVLAITGRAAAQDRPTLSGAWTASALSESWSVSAWGDACGPKPAGRGAGGGSVQIKEQNGELSISGAGRAFSTAECWEQMPGLSRVGHSASGGRSWRTRCASPANDPRRAAITTTMTATDSSIQLGEVGDFQFIIQDTKCHATVTRSRSFTLVRREGDTPPAAPTASATAAPTAGAAPVASASAAPVASAAPSAVRAPAAPRAPRAPSYDGMLGEGGPNDAGEAEPAAVPVSSAGTIGGRTTTGEDVARERKVRFVAIVGGLAAALGFAGLIIARRGRRRFDAGEPEAPPSARAAPRVHEPPPPPPEPPRAAPAQAPPPAQNRGRGKICPTCGERYDGDATFCGRDATQLVLLN